MMGKAYSDDLRQRILRVVDRCLPVRQVPTLFEVSASFIYKALIRRCTTGETGVCMRQVVKKLVGYHEALLEQKRLQTDITELQRQLFKTFGVSSSIGGLWKTLNKLGLSFKNMPCCRTDVPDVRQARTIWHSHQSTFNPAQLIFIPTTS